MIINSIRILILLILFLYSFSLKAEKVEGYQWNLDINQWVAGGMAGSKTSEGYPAYPIELSLHNKMIGHNPSKDDIFEIEFVVMDWIKKHKFSKVVLAKGSATASVLWPDDFDLNESGVTPWGDYSEFKWNAYFEDELVAWGSFSSNVFDRKIDLRIYK